MTAKKKVLIANGQGFWGDSILGPVRLVKEGPLDYLTLDYLAEVTMSIMQKLRSRKPEMGYATDFVKLIERVLPDLVEKDIKVVANAGGVNPHACKDAVMKVVEAQGFKGMKVAVVEGDDILENLDDLMQGGEEFKNMDTGEPLSTVRDRVTSANVYLGAFPIAEALSQGAQIVITGRGTDPGLVIGPMIHEFGWTENDLDKLAAGTIAGHIVECGAQCTGGNFTDWRTIENMAMVGYPIIEAHPDGTFAVTKHEGTGGRVDRNTVTHQLAYEMGNPADYLTPDVRADFTSFKLTEEGSDRVTISDVKGKPATNTYKVSMSYQDGWKSMGQLVVSGPDALAKAKLCAEIVWQRLTYDGYEYSEEERVVEFLGDNVCHAGVNIDGAGESSEIVLRMGVQRPGSREGRALWFRTRAARDQRSARRHRLCRRTTESDGNHRLLASAARQVQSRNARLGIHFGRCQVTKVLLSRIACARSGDKGEGSNVGIIARSEAAYSFLKEALSTEVVRDHLAAINFGDVIRYEADNMLVLNFLLGDSLGGGGSASLKTDAQGKTHGLALLRMELDVPEAVLSGTPA